MFQIWLLKVAILAFSVETARSLEIEDSKSSVDELCETATSDDLVYAALDQINLFGINYLGFDSFSELKPRCDFQKYFTHQNDTPVFKVFNQNHLICHLKKQECAEIVVKKSVEYGQDSTFLVRFLPDYSVFLNESIDLTNLANQSGLSDFEVKLFLIDGLEIKTGMPIIQLPVNGWSFTRVSMHLSNWEFYYDGKRLNKQTCLDAIVEEHASNRSDQVRFFSEFQSAHYEMSSNSRLTHGLCPVVFQNSRINTLTFNSLTRSKLILNTLEIYDVEKIVDANRSTTIQAYMKHRLNSEIFNLKMIGSYNLDLDHKTVDRFVFKNMTVLYFTGSLNNIDTDFFKPFAFLSSVMLETVNMRQFIHDGSTSNNEWMRYLDHESPFYMYWLVIYFGDFGSHYTYPSEDFCLFKHFPVKLESRTLGYLVIETDLRIREVFLKQATKSCILQYMYSANRFDNVTSKDIEFIIYDLYDESIANECNFSTRLNKCDLTTFEKTKDNFYLNIYDTTNLLEWIDLIGPIIIFPIVCLFGFVTNLLVIVVITRRRFKEDFQQRLFKYILLNSIFNCIECALNLLQLTSECIAPNSVFCSSVRLTSFSFVLRVYFVGYLGEIMKTCSILTCLFFSFERLLDLYESKNKLILAFHNIKMSRIVTGTILFAIVSSMIKIFEFDFKHLSDSETDRGFEFPHRFFICLVNSKYLLYVLSILHYFLNDFFFLLVNCLVDFTLLIRIKKSFLIKLKLKTKVSCPKTKETINMVNQEYSKKHKTVRKTYYLLVFNLVTYLLCRLPELAFIFFAYSYYSVQMTLSEDGFILNILNCEYFSLCYLLANLIDFLYMISYTTNIYSYYKFNKIFKKNLLLFLRFN